MPNWQIWKDEVSSRARTIKICHPSDRHTGKNRERGCRCRNAALRDGTRIFQRCVEEEIGIVGEGYVGLRLPFQDAKLHDRGRVNWTTIGWSCFSIVNFLLLIDFLRWSLLTNIWLLIHMLLRVLVAVSQSIHMSSASPPSSPGSLSSSSHWRLAWYSPWRRLKFLISDFAIASAKTLDVRRCYPCLILKKVRLWVGGTGQVKPKEPTAMWEGASEMNFQKTVTMEGTIIVCLWGTGTSLFVLLGRMQPRCWNERWKDWGTTWGRFHNLQKAIDVLISRIAAKNVEFKGLTNVWLNVRCRRSIKTKEMRVEVSKSWRWVESRMAAEATGSWLLFGFGTFPLQVQKRSVGRPD